MTIISAGGAVVGAGAAGGYQIERSLRSNGTYAGGTDYMQRQNSGTSGNRKVWTLSLWMKICNITSNDEHIWIVSNTGVAGNPSAYVRLILEGNVLKLGSNSSASEAFASAALLRDVSAWYHVVISCDNANTILRVYVNGVEWTTTNGFLASKTNPTDTDGVVNNASYYNTFSMLRTAEPRTFNGYVAEIHFVDGSALPASTFGEFNSETGVWQPIQVTGVTYGTQGYYLPLNDNASTTTLGYDAAGSNDFTLSGFSVNAGADNDSLVDTPTPYGTDTGVGGEVRGNYATWNPLDVRSTATLTNGNLDISVSTVNGVRRATLGLSSGKWYWEILITSSLGYSVVGVADSTCVTWDAGGGFFYTGNSSVPFSEKVDYSGTRTSYGASYTNGDIIGVALDMDSGSITFYKNGASQGVAFSSNIAGKTLFPAASQSNASAISSTANFGQRPFADTAPSGFKALCTQNLPESEATIVDGGEYFNTVLWTGNNTYPRSITGYGFQPDFVWAKNRSDAYYHQTYDSLRGTGTGGGVLYTNTNDEVDDTYKLSSFDSDGFTLSSSLTALNGSGEAVVGWAWKANGAGVSNTDGTITSTVSANTDAGFSIVTFTTPATNTTSTLGHGLGIAPSLIIAKSRSTTSSWYVYHASLGATKAVFLNSTGAEDTSQKYWNNTAPTLSVFTIMQTGVAWWDLSATHVAYCFAAIPGYSAFGSYTGNNAADGTFVYLGFRPSFLMIKSTSGSTEWVMVDNTRPSTTPGVRNFNLVDTSLYANRAYSEATIGTVDDIDLLSNGFKLRNNTGFVNASQTYIYMAFAESPFKYALAR
jgi:hypothetical protein